MRPEPVNELLPPRLPKLRLLHSQGANVVSIDRIWRNCLVAFLLHTALCNRLRHNTFGRLPPQFTRWPTVTLGHASCRRVIGGTFDGFGYGRRYESALL